MDDSLTQKYIIITKQLTDRDNKCYMKKIKLKFNNLERKENIDRETIERFCEALKNLDTRNQEQKKFEKIIENEQTEESEEEKEEREERDVDKKKQKLNHLPNLDTYFKILDISYNNLNETNLFQIISSIYDNKKIIGLNVKHNKITNNILEKIILIIKENKYFTYLNIQNTDLNFQEIQNIIFYSLNKNNIKTLKLPSLNLYAFQTLVSNLKNNTSLEKLHFFITTNTNSSNLNKHMENELQERNQQLLLKKLKKTFYNFLDIIEYKNNLLNIKCGIDFEDEEFEELIKSTVSICEEHKEFLETENKVKKNKLDINSTEIINLLKEEIMGHNIHIPKFEKEQSKIFEPEETSIIKNLLF